MKISVVIPAYNEEDYISGCLKSLRKQVEPADEIIVVDNNCTDKTAKIALDFGARVIKEKKQGITYARNTGFNSARYGIIARTDADTRVEKDWIKKIKANFVSAYPPDALTGPVIFYDLPGKTPFYARVFFYGTKFILGHNILAGPNMALTKFIWEKVKNKICIDDTKVHEDIDLAIHINEAGGRIKIDNSLIVKFSSRRIKQRPHSFFIEYPLRLIRMFFLHRRDLEPV